MSTMWKKNVIDAIKSVNHQSLNRLLKHTSAPSQRPDSNRPANAVIASESHGYPYGNELTTSSAVLLRLNSVNNDNAYFHVNFRDIDDVFGRSPLLWAASDCNASFIRVLLEHGADIEAKDRDGNCALIWYVKHR